MMRRHGLSTTAIHGSPHRGPDWSPAVTPIYQSATFRNPVGSADEVLYAPRHPYTRGLLDSVPANNEGRARLRQIPGMTPSLAHLPAGCSFRERCGHADAACLSVPEFENRVRCHHPLC